MTNKENNAVKQARLFAEALQGEDYEAAWKLLAPGCVYFQLARDLKGPEAVVASYEHGAKWGVDQFDSIERESSVKPTEDGQAMLTFFYKIRHKGKSLRIRSEQIIELDAAGLIGRIEHVELASQANALFKFYFETGIISKSGGNS
jgi:ketosteroid isomerase-like protein